ncbi:MAG: RHS repeat-associated core domain-containing protein [Theionarchaea archaeon]|nr:RHS repeat-associated core domain-containing protein [Theionarchaea archaeon]
MEETEEPGEEELNYTFTHDDYGNCITKSDGITTWEYTYDHENRLLSVAENGQITEEYIYNGDGQRIKKIDSESTRIYVNTGIDVLYEINITTQMEAIYVYGPTGKIAKKVNDITEFYHIDHLGSTRLTTSETGAPVTELEYKPFGELINPSEEKYTFNGKELDSTSLYYYGARYYDPDTGRFLTRDPLIGERDSPQTLNRYVYCLNSPLKYVDPTGLDEDEVVRSIFQRLLNLSPDLLGMDLDEFIEEKGSLIDALMELIELLGYDLVAYNYENNFIVFSTDQGNITLVVDNEKCREESSYGLYDYESETIYISTEKPNTIADLVTVFLHEVCHHALSRLYPKESNLSREHFYIYGAQIEYMGEIADRSKEAGLANPYSLKYRINERIMWFFCYKIRPAPK